MSVGLRLTREGSVFSGFQRLTTCAYHCVMDRRGEGQASGGHNPYGNRGRGNRPVRGHRYSSGANSWRGGGRHGRRREWVHTEAATDDGNGKPHRERRGGNRPPRGLSGRAIGMWYAKQGSRKKLEREMQNRKTIFMDEEQIEQVHRVLSSSQLQKRKGQEAGFSQEEDSAINNDDTLASFSEVDDFVPPLKDSWFNAGFDAFESPHLNKKLQEDVEKKMENPKFVKMQEFRKTLPAYQKKLELMSLINSEQVIVISGETGCGKTTQVPQFILDDAIAQGRGMECKVVCTQPRRISAISVAERVAEERGEVCGSDSCGYQIRLDSKLPRLNASILYCTTGILIQWLKSDPLIKNVSHIVLDEIHERDLLTDFLITIVKGITEARKDLKVILMSATLNAELFSLYFGNCPCFHIPGFTYPVTSMYLEEVMDFTKYHPPEAAYSLVNDIERMYDGNMRKYQMSRLMSKNIHPGLIDSWKEYEKTELVGKIARSDSNKLFAMHAYSQNNVDPQLIVSTIKYIVQEQSEGAILVFVPGWMDIKAVNDELSRHKEFSSDKFLIIPLHSLMPTTNQRQVFNRPPKGVTKIVIATNIAETSITIDDVVHVIDTGKIKITDFDHTTNMGSLQMKWISRANAKQRRGRAGRVQEGFCYHLYTKLQEKDFDDFLLPEMLRTPLDQLCLQIRVLELGKIEEFLSKVMEPPALDSINLSVRKLVALSAMDTDQNLTPLGYHLAKLPVEPQIGKMILMGAIFSCLDPVLTIAANLSFKDPFVVPLGQEKDADRRRKALADGSNSDHIMHFNAFKGWEKAKNKGHREENNYCWNNFLSKSTLGMLRDMKGQFVNHLHSIGFSSSSDTKDPVMNRLSKNMKVVTAIVCAGLYPNVCKIGFANPKRPVKLQSKTERKLEFHPKSVNYGVTGNQFREQWLCYYLKMKTTGIFVFDSSEVTAYPLLFFGGKISSYYDQQMKGDVIAVDDWIVFKSKPHIAKLVQDLRKALDDILERKIRDPDVTVLTNDDTSSKVLASIVDLITTE